MSCKQLRGDINYAWPSANIAVMGAEGAVEILYSKEIKAIEDPAAKAAAAEEKKKEYNDLFCNPYNAASYGYAYFLTILKNFNDTGLWIKLMSKKHGLRIPVPHF